MCKQHIYTCINTHKHIYAYVPKNINISLYTHVTDVHTGRHTYICTRHAHIYIHLQQVYMYGCINKHMKRYVRTQANCGSLWAGERIPL